MQLCEQELGADLFAQVYALLRSRQEGQLFAADYDAQMRDELRMLMGTAKLRFWPLVDQLIFCEDVEEDAELQPTLW